MAPYEEPNPFILKDFIIVESPYTTKDCNVKPMSDILLANQVQISEWTALNYTASIPMNVLEIEQYIANEINTFLMKATLARRCDNYVIQGFNLPSECTSTFNNFPSNQSQFGIGVDVLNKFIYTDDYIQKQTSANDKKPLCQRMNDLNNLLVKFDQILLRLNTSEIKAKYPDQYQTLMTKYKENVNMRMLLDQRLDNIYSNESAYGNSKRYMDSTIYTSVLWTVLATTFIFYIFKKM